MAWLLFLGTMLGSCQKKDDMIYNSHAMSHEKLYRSASAVPYYESWNDIFNYYNPIHNGDSLMEQSVQIDKHFVSMKSLYDAFEHAEAEVAAFYDTLSLATIVAHNIDTNNFKHSDAFYSHAKVIKVIHNSTDGTSWSEMDIFDGHLGAMVNAHGLMMIGKTLYRFGWDFIQWMRYTGHAADISTLLQTDGANPAKGIDCVFLREKSGQNSNQWSGVWSKGCSGDDGRLRVLGYIDFIKHPHESLPHTHWWQLHTNTKSMIRRKFIRTWYDAFRPASRSTTASNITTSYFDNFFPDWSLPIVGDFYPAGLFSVGSNFGENWFLHNIVRTNGNQQNIITVGQDIIFYSGTFTSRAITSTPTDWTANCICNY